MNDRKEQPRREGTDHGSYLIPPDPAVLAQQEQRFRSFFTDGPAGQAFADLDGRFAAANNAFCRMLGRSPADILGDTVVELTHPDDRARTAELVGDLLAGRIVSYQMAKRLLRADGTAVPVLNTVTIVEAGGERFMAAVSVELREITRPNQPLRVEIDDRTATTHEALDGEADQWRHDWPADLDQLHLKWLWAAVTTTGYELVSALDPDGIIRYSSGASSKLLGADSNDVVGRSAFEIMHPADQKVVRTTFADCVRRRTGWQRLRLRALRPDGSVVWVESSAVAHLDDDGALIGFTATTRRLVGDEAAASQRAVTRARVQRTIRSRRLRTVWQPISSLGTGRIVGVEALSRFTDREIVQSPDRWFAEAHQADLGPQLELVAVETALGSAGSLPESVYLSLNVSPPTIASGGVAAAIEAAMISPERIVLELTEHVSIDDYAALTAALERLRQSGIRLAVDDAGAGFASFRHILRLKPDIIKLDQSITRGIDGNAAQRALAAALVMFAMDVGSITVIAEGVESEPELSTISTLGIDAVQGYFLARPAAAAEIDFDKIAPHAWT